MTDNDRTPGTKEPRSEPEIIPPRAGTRLRQPDAMWFSFDERGTRRIYITRLGPFGAIPLALVVGLVAALLLVFLVGALPIWIAAIALLVTIAIISTLMRQSFRRKH
jgi:hypothetical protein